MLASLKERVFLCLKSSKSEEELIEAKSAIALLGGKFIEEKIDITC